jgi:hypothetical protein
MTNRFLYVLGAPTTYQIATVDPVGQVLTLTAPYAGPPDNYAAYCVRPPPAERRLIYYSQSGLPEAWPAVNALSLQEDGDEITGLMAKGSFLYIIEKRHIYRFTFQSNPATDGFVFLSAQRGCINHRCWVQVEDMAYMLDELGVHAFSGGQECEPISGPVQDLFRPSDSMFKINWKASKWFHCAHNRVQETIRWFVSLSGDYLPRHAVVYDYRRKRWWIEAYPYPVGAAVVGYINGVPKLLLGADARRVFSLWEGVLDGPDPTAGTVRGTVTSSTMLTITDALASYAGSGLVNAPLSIVAGTGKNQVRRIVAVSGQTITVSEPWLIKPDTTSVYQIGGVQWQYWSGDFRFAQSENTTERRVEVVFSQTINPCTFDMHLYIDFAPTPLIWNMDNVLDDGRGFTPSVGSTDLVADMTKTAGFVQQRIEGHKDFYLDGARFLSVELVGFTNADPLSIYGLVIDGVAEG